MKGLRFSLLIIVLAALFHFVPWFDRPEAATVRALGVVSGGLRSATRAVWGVPGAVRGAADLRTESDRLNDEVSALRSRLAELAGAADENVALRAMLMFSKRTDATRISANVIGADPDPTLHTVVIDRGSTDGVRRGDAVIAYDGVFVGKALNVGDGRTTVLLSYDAHSKVGAMVQGRPEANGVASGDRGLVVTLSLIPQNAAIAPGDLVVTTGLELGVPRGLLIGTVDSVQRTPSEPFASATVIPATDALRLTAVAVVHSR